MKPYISDIPCDYDDCSAHVEITDVRFFHSSDDAGHTCVVFYRCLDGHRWFRDMGPEVITDAGREMFA